MNDKNINLVSGENEQAKSEKKKLKKVRLIAFFSLIIVALFSVIVFLINITLPIQSVIQDQKVTSDSIFLLHGKLVKLYLIKDRVNNLSAILLQRKDYIAPVDKIFALLPSDLSVDGLVLDKNILTLTISGNSLSSINEFIDAVVTLGANKKLISDIGIQGIKLDSSAGNYSLSLQLIIP